jgi:hypothetical protein
MPVAYFMASLGCLLATTWCFRVNQPYRRAIDASLAADGEMQVPERMWPFYNADYLNAFIAKASEQQTDFGKTALALYVRPTLIWNDIGFAVFCAAFAMLFWLGLLKAMPDYPLIKCLMAFLVAMSAIYGVADIAEDLWLVGLFSKSGEVTKFEGEIACALTQTKIVTISLSIAGGLLFKVLDSALSKGMVKTY